MHAGQHTIQSRTPACASTAACAGFRDARASHCPQLRASHPLPSIACLPTDFRPQVQGLCHNYNQVSASLVQTSRRWACLRPAHTPRSSPTSPALSTFGRPATACVLPPNCCACHLACRHAVAVPDLRGDQGHYVPCFMTFHRAVRCSRAQHCGQRWCSGTASAGRANLRWHVYFGSQWVCQSEVSAAFGTSMPSPFGPETRPRHPTPVVFAPPLPVRAGDAGVRECPTVCGAGAEGHALLVSAGQIITSPSIGAAAGSVQLLQPGA